MAAAKRRCFAKEAEIFNFRLSKLLKELPTFSQAVRSFPNPCYRAGKRIKNALYLIGGASAEGIAETCSPSRRDWQRERAPESACEQFQPEGAFGHRQEGGGWAVGIMGFSFPPLVGFRSEKAAQIAVYFLAASGGEKDKLALIKLIYIAERESVRGRNRPMIYDEYYSLKHGPICSSALDAINGNIDKEVWDKYISRGEGHKIRSVCDCDFDQLSISDMRILDDVVIAHGDKSAAELRNWTHDNCPEYTEINDSRRVPIDLDQMARAVEVLHPKAVLEEAQAYRSLEILLPRK